MAFPISYQDPSGKMAASVSEPLLELWIASFFLPYSLLSSYLGIFLSQLFSPPYSPSPSPHCELYSLKETHVEPFIQVITPSKAWLSIPTGIEWTLWLSEGLMSLVWLETWEGRKCSYPCNHTNPCCTNFGLVVCCDRMDTEGLSYSFTGGPALKKTPTLDAWHSEFCGL